MIKKLIVVLALLGFGFGYLRGEVRPEESAKSLGEPTTIVPTNVVVSHQADALAVPSLAVICPAGNKKAWLSVSGLCHALLFYGLGPTDLPGYPSAELVLQALTDEELAIATFGKSPFVRTRNGLRYYVLNDPVAHTDAAEAHRDQCLSTFGAINLPLTTPIRLKAKSYTVADLLAESVANFDLKQKEPAWTALAYAKYLPPQQGWTNRFGEKTSFSALTQHLLSLDFNVQSCGGSHIFQALAKLDNADRAHSILDAGTRVQLHSFLAKTLEQLARRQAADGSWSKDWCDSTTTEYNGPLTPFQVRILITGHLLEVLTALDQAKRPPEAVYTRAAEWLRVSLHSAEIKPDGMMICPFTHAARTAREILASQPHGADAFHRTE